MKWIARVLVFTTAMVFGTFIASFFWATPVATTPVVSIRVPLRADDLIGTWKGVWGYDEGECRIEIYRVDRDDFYGTLRKEGAEVRFEGTFVPMTRKFYFVETEVVRLGSDMTGWSLGKNSGIISLDGHMLVGDGRDQWGQYRWAVSKY